MAAQTLAIGIVGAGYWGKNLLRTFGKLPGARIAEICDLDPKLLEAAKKDHPDARTGGDLHAMLARPDLDAILVASPRSRRAIARAAAGRRTTACPASRSCSATCRRCRC